MWVKDTLEDLSDILGIVGGTLGAIVLGCLLVGRVANEAEWVTLEAKAEQLRIDIQNVDSKMAEDVAGQVAAINQEIAANRAWRKTIFWWMIPGGWETLEFVPMPE